MAVYNWAICSLDEVLNALTEKTITTEEQTLLERIINAVTDYIEGECNRYIKRRADLIVEYPYSEGAKYIFLKNPPVEVVNVYVDVTGRFGSDTLLSSDDYFVDEGLGLVIKRVGTFPSGVKVVKVEYYGGFENVPEDLKDVAIQLVIATYRKYKLKTIGSTSIGFQGESKNFVILPDAHQQSIINRYRLKIC